MNKEMTIPRDGRIIEGIVSGKPLKSKGGRSA